MEHENEPGDMCLSFGPYPREVLRVHADGRHEWFSPTREEAEQVVWMIEERGVHSVYGVSPALVEVILQEARDMARVKN